MSQGVDVGDNAIVLDSVVMPGVRIGKGARLKRAIVEEGVEIPAHFQVGYDRDKDRRQHIVTKSGVVVVSKLSSESEPVTLSVSHRDAFRQAMP